MSLHPHAKAYLIVATVLSSTMLAGCPTEPARNLLASEPQAGNEAPAPSGIADPRETISTEASQPGESEQEVSSVAEAATPTQNSITGTWAGTAAMRWTYTSVYGDDTSSAEDAVEFTFGEDGLPTSIPVCEGHSFNLVDARIGATQSYSVELPYGDEPIDFTITMTQLEHGDGYLYMRFEWDFELYTGLSDGASSLMESREEYQFELDGDVLMYTHDVFMSGTSYSEWGPSPSTMIQHDSAELTRS